MGKRVLVVDNDRLCADLLGHVLTEAGYVVDKAYDGMEALEQLQRLTPDVVLLDIVMPRVPGERVFRYIRENPATSAVPVIILSGTLIENREKLLDLGADGYIAKAGREEMRRNLLAVLDRVERREPASTEVLGAEHMLPREKVRELVDLREYVQALLRALGEGVMELDGRRRVVAANRAALEVLDRSEVSLLGTPVHELFEPAQRAAIEDLLQQYHADPGRTTAPLEIRHRDRVLHVALAPIGAAPFEESCFAILHDVTDLAAKIEDLSTLNRRLQAMDRMRAELLTMVSHDLHTPLTAIKGSLDVLMHENVGIELTQELLGIAQKNTARLFRLVSDILDLARIEAGRFKQRRERFDVAACLRGIVDRLRRLAQDRGITLGLALPESVPSIWADGVRIEQVFTNLLGNALKFTARGGEIGVSVEDAGPELRARVWDTGVGIAAEHVGRVFDRFYRVPLPAGTDVEGTGLGLAICKAVVEEHGGRIWVESAPGKGTSFSLTIPKGEPPLADASLLAHAQMD